MANPMIEYDHSVLRVNDQILAERFFKQIFSEIYGEDSVTAEFVAPRTTEEYLDLIATRGGTGRIAEEAAQSRGFSRGDQTGGRPVGFGQDTVKIGGALIPLFLARKHEQEPPLEQLRGHPRHAFPVTPEQMAKAMAVLRKYDVDFGGPVDYPPPCPIARSIYFKDPSSNFLELTIRRDEE